MNATSPAAPRFSALSRAVALVTLAALLSACTTSRLPPISAVGPGFEPAKDESLLWIESRAEEESLLGQAELYEDPRLGDYLSGIVTRLTPEAMVANRSISYSIQVVSDPTLNAFAYPHGALYIHTGLLARMNSEDELATVLGHEMTHIENRHMLRYRRSARNKNIGWSIAALAAALILEDEEYDQIAEGDWGEAMLIGVLGDVLVGLGLQLAFLASVNGYGRDLELEADHGGFEKLRAAGYEPAAAADVYATLVEASSDPGRLEGFFFGSHPKLSARLDSANEWLAEQPEDAGEQPSAAADGPDGPNEAADRQAEFRRRLLPVIRDDARFHLETGDFEMAQAQIDKALAWMPADPETHRLLAQLHLARAENEDEAAAEEQYRAAEAALREAIRLDPELAYAHWDLGFLLYDLGHRTEACTSLRHFLELAPADEDADTVRDHLAELEGDGAC